MSHSPRPRHTDSRCWRPLAVLTAAALLAALPAGAIVPKKAQDRLDDVAFRIPELSVPSMPMPASEARLAPDLADRFAALDRFATEAGGTWTFSVEKLSGSVSVEGSGIGWIPGSASGITYEALGVGRPTGRPNAIPVDVVAAKALDFVDRHRGIFGLSRGALVLEEGSSGPMLERLYYVHFRVERGGVPVEHARLTFRMSSGNLVQFGSEGVSPSLAAVDTVPAIDVATAWQILWDFAGGPFGQEALQKARLLIVPTTRANALTDATIPPGRGITYRLVWVLGFHRPGVDGNWEGRVDAKTGELISFADQDLYGMVRGGTYKTDRPATAVTMPFQMADYGAGIYADVAGNFPGTTGTSTMSGRTGSAGIVGGVRINDNCGAISKAADASGVIDFGTSAGTDCTTPGTGGAGNTHAARTQFWNVSAIKIKGYTYLSGTPAAATWLQGQLTANVNVNNTCNANWNGSQINFFRSGGGCANTGELPGVSLHEWGHGMDSNDGNGGSPDRGTGETYGDVSAFLQTHGSCIGNGFLGGNCGAYGDACTACTGVRDVDYAKHANPAPETVGNPMGGGMTCPLSTTYQGPCTREGHCESYPSSESVWDLATRDLVTWGLDATSAWQLVDELWYASRPTSTAAYACGNNTSCNNGNLFRAFRIVDDCDGNLANGTPHASAIWNAFNRHRTGCAGDVQTDNNCGCAVLGATTLSGTPGNNSVTLSWTAVAGASSYDVFRNDTSCTAGFAKIGNTATLGFVDSLAVNGVTYFYRVQPLGAGACPSGPMSNCQTLTPVPGPEARYRSGTAAQTLDTGDDDAYPDNCETVTVGFTVENSGSGALTNVRITAISSAFGGVAVTTAMPISLGDLAAAGSVNGSFQYTLGAGATKATCGQSVPFSITVAANEMSGTRAGSFSFTAEQDVVVNPTLTYDFEAGTQGWTVQTGTFNRTNTYGSSGGGSFAMASSSNLDDQCDQIRSPLFIPSATTTMTLATRFAIETGPTWWDRANVKVWDTTASSKTLISPTSGRAYNASGVNGVCDTSGQNGWASTLDTWADSTFPTAVFSPFASKLVQLEVDFGTDSSVVSTGFRFDNVRLTNVSTIACDAQSDTCGSVPDLTIAKTHVGNFDQGQAGAQYTITVTNSGTGPTSGTVTVTDVVPAGLTATAISGTGWTCTQPAGPCTRSTVLAAAGSYPALTLTVTVSCSAAASVTNTASVSGGGETNTANNSGANPTTVNQTAPGAAGAPTATPACTSVGLSWAAVANATDYEVWRNTGASCAGAVQVVSTTAGATTYDDTGRSAGTQYSYFVVAKNATCTGPNGACTTTTTLDVPAAPAAPTFSAITCTGQTVDWTAVPGATSYDVWRSTGGSCAGATKITVSPVAGTSYADSGLAAATQYSYYVVANNACGISANGACASSATVSCGPVIVFQSIGANTEVSGNGNGVMEAGEKWSVPVTLTNTGTASADNVTATLSGMGAGDGFTLCNAPGSFGTIGVGGTSSYTFEFIVDSTMWYSTYSCGTAMTFNVVGKSTTTGGCTCVDETAAFSRNVGAGAQNETATQVTTPLNATSGSATSTLAPAFTITGTPTTATLTYTPSYVGGGSGTLLVDEFPDNANWTTTGTVNNDATTPSTCAGNPSANSLQLTGTSTAFHDFAVTGYTGLTLTVDHFSASNLDAGERLTVAYSTDGGGAFTTMFQGVDAGDGVWTCGTTYSTFPASATLRIRFSLNANNGGESARVDHFSLTGTPPAGGSFTANAQVELVDPSATATVLKAYGAADASPYDVAALYTGAGTYSIRLSENAGGTATVTAGSLDVTKAASCATSAATCAATPKPTSDKATATPMRGTKNATIPTDIDVTWDVTTCGGASAEYNMYWGPIGSWASFSGGSCSLGVTGSRTGITPAPTDIWWIITGVSGTTPADKWAIFGYDSNSNPEAFTGASGICAQTGGQDTSQVCP